MAIIAWSFPLKTAADWDMVIIDSLYKKSPGPYLKVLSPTPYDLPFSYNTSVTDDDG